MKLPRWLVISMLSVSVLAVPGAAAWWWVNWPDQTAREFIALIHEQRENEANELLSLTDGWRVICLDKENQRGAFLIRGKISDSRRSFIWIGEPWSLQSRSASDLLRGRRWFQSGVNEIDFVAIKGKVYCDNSREPIRWQSTKLMPPKAFTEEE